MSEGVEATNEDLVGTVLEVLPVLLAEGRTDEVLEAVRALVARNEHARAAARSDGADHHEEQRGGEQGSAAAVLG